MDTYFLQTSIGRIEDYLVRSQSEPGGSIIVQNGARVCYVANTCGICHFLKDIGHYLMTENLHFYHLNIL